MLEKILQSSQNPERLSLTVKGVLLGFVPFVLFVSRSYGLEGVSQSWLTEVIESISLLAQQATALVSTMVVLWGLVRKVVPRK